MHKQVADAFFQQEDVLHQILIVHFSCLLPLTEQAVKVLENLLMLLRHLLDVSLQLGILDLVRRLFAFGLDVYKRQAS